MGVKADLGKEASFIKDIRLYLTAQDAEPLFQAMRLHRDIKIVKEKSAIAEIQGRKTLQMYIFLAWTTTPWTLTV